MVSGHCQAPKKERKKLSPPPPTGQHPEYAPDGPSQLALDKALIDTV